MLLGQKLPAPYQDWRVVESDLYDIASRVREYDPDAALLRNQKTGQLGLGEWHPQRAAYVVSREMHDMDTDAPLVGEPDPRALRCQRGYDLRNWRSVQDFQRAMRDAHYRNEERATRTSVESFGDPSERYVHARGRDLGVTNRAFIRDYERTAA